MLTLSKQQQSNGWLVVLSAADSQGQSTWFSQLVGSEAEANHLIEELGRQHPQAIKEPRRYRFGDALC